MIDFETCSHFQKIQGYFRLCQSPSKLLRFLLFHFLSKTRTIVDSNQFHQEICHLLKMAKETLSEILGQVQISDVSFNNAILTVIIC